ncbi:hypothetical protein [Cesiribacter andamanensis]|uniref:PEGA domain-containing protein n=1 Tax=Cesiribacter andamanensis AMV16 TaxID=1279009 RepID=M7N6B7_9BACT|nr:hypothetical protein [Cesiribacter andamanensis]EMR04173.1 hypothetical protein ADICEAN_00697 [Cesiribacter andamanensis AMV16]
MQKFLQRALAGLFLLVLVSGCASIVSKSTYPVTFNTSPSGADIKITNQFGMVMYEGSTPTTIPLAAGDGFFQKARYQVTISMFGYKSQTFPLEATLDGWYFGNLVFGGLIGMLIVDPATGAMWKLPTSYLQYSLSPSDQASLKIMSIDELPEHLRDKLEPLNEESITN